MDFHFSRQVGFYVLQTYIPCNLIVLLSWVSFWINKDAVPARITLTVTTMLTMTTQLTSSVSNTMRVSYPKALDVWYAVCMLFVFAALLEYAFVNVLSRRESSLFKTSLRQSQAKRAMAGQRNGNDRVRIQFRCLVCFAHESSAYYMM